MLQKITVAKRSKNFHKNEGFSLVELLIYIGILGAVSGILVGVLNTVTTTQVQESSQNDVTGQLNFITQTIQRLVRTSSLVQLDAGVATTTLKLRMPTIANDPTYIYLSNGQVYVKVTDTGTPQTISSNSVNVDSLQFKKLSQPPGKDTVQIDIALSAIQQAAGKTISKALETAVSRVSAATFDSDLLPNADNSYAVGADPSSRWKSASFSQGVNMATISGNVGIGTTTPSYTLDVVGGFRSSDTSTFSGNLGLGTASPSYTLDVVGGLRASVTSTFSGNVGIGTTTPSAKLHLLATTEQLRLGYSTSSYDSLTVGSTGSLTVAATGTNPNITLTPGGSGYTILNGNVGLGTSTPNQVLTVNGNISLVGASPTYTLTNVISPVNSSDVATKGYVDAASGGGAKIVKTYGSSGGGGASIDCGSGYVIERCGKGYGSSAVAAQSYAAAVYGGDMSGTAWAVCTYTDVGSQTASYNSGTYSAIIAKCIKP